MNKATVISTFKAAQKLAENLSIEDKEVVNKKLDAALACLRLADWSMITKLSISWEIVHDTGGLIIAVLPNIILESETP